MNDFDAVVTTRQYVLGSVVNPLPAGSAGHVPTWFDLDQFSAEIVVSHSILSEGVSPLFVAPPISKTRGYWADHTTIIMDFRGTAIAEFHTLPSRPSNPLPAPLPKHGKKGTLISSSLIISA